MYKNLAFNQSIPLKVIVKAQNNDIDAFEEIYRSYYQACFSLAFRICRDRNMSQDIVHDAFISILNKISTLRNTTAFTGWIKRITTNTAINKLKNIQKFNDTEEVEEEGLMSDDLFHVNWLEYTNDLEKLLSDLSTTARTVLILHEVEGYNHKEIAEIFGKSESFSKVTLSRAYRQLKQLVENQKVLLCI